MQADSEQARPPEPVSGSLESTRRASLIPWVPLAILAVAGCLVIWYGTRWGPWAFSDGVGYIVNARNLVLGRGLGLYRASGDFILLVTHPPLYPWLLAGLGKAGMDLVAAARWLDVVFFGSFLFIGGWGFWRLTRSAWLAVGLTAVLLVHPALDLAYLSAMSEPLFLFCIMSSLLLLADYLQTGKRNRLILSAIASAGALMTRYPGAAVIIACVLGVWLLTDTPWRRKIRESLSYLVISISPTLAFVLWTRFGLGARNPRGVNESFDLASLLTNFISHAADAIWNWKPVPPDVIPNQILPTSITHPLAGILAITLTVGLAWSVTAVARRRRLIASASKAKIDWRPAALFALFLASYLGFFLAAYLVTFPTPDVNARTLLPLLPGGLLLAFALADIVRRAAPPAPIFNGLAAATVILAVAGWVIISQDTVIGMHRTGLGYTSREWRGSPTIAAIDGLPADMSLVSNETAAVLLYTDRSAYEIPGLKAGDSSPLSVPFGSGTSELDQNFRAGRAALVLFNTVKGQLKAGSEAAQGLNPSELVQGLTPVFDGSDGAIYCHCSMTGP